MPFLTLRFHGQAACPANCSQEDAVKLAGRSHVTSPAPPWQAREGSSFPQQREVSCSLFYLLLFVPLKVISFYTWFVIPLCIECVSFRNDLFIIIIMHSTSILLSNNGVLWALIALLLSLPVQQLLRRALRLNYNTDSSLIPCCLTSFG